MNAVLEQMGKIGIIPVVVLNDAKDAAPLAKALCEGGLPCAEVTFRTAAAEESIRIMAKEFPEMLVGAGTVLTTEQVDRAVNAVGQIHAGDGDVGGDFHDVQTVNAAEFLFLGLGSTGHAGKLLIHSEIVLKGDGSESLGL